MRLQLVTAGQPRCSRAEATTHPPRRTGEAAEISSGTCPVTATLSPVSTGPNTASRLVIATLARESARKRDHRAGAGGRPRGSGSARPAQGAVLVHVRDGVPRIRAPPRARDQAWFDQFQ